MQAKIKVIGVGDAGCNIVNRLIEDNVANVTFSQINTDKEYMKTAKSNSRKIIGESVTFGLGCGTDVAKGRKAAIDAQEDLKRIMEGNDMIFLTAGMGGGTGTGALPVVAKIAKELNILTIAIVTTPFSFEGSKRMIKANEAINELREIVDALIIVSNDKLVKTSPKNLTIKEAFKVADSVLKESIIGITKIITETGNINIDFADVKTILGYKGGAYIGFGIGTGDYAISKALNDAIENPITDIKIDDAKGVIISIAGKDLNLIELNDAMRELNFRVNQDANIIFGTSFEENDYVKVIIIATGIEK